MVYDYVNPLCYRYLPKDSELCNGLRSYSSLTLLSRIERIVPEFLLPRTVSLELTLQNIALTSKGVLVTKRVDGQKRGEIPAEEIFNDYASRLKRRRDVLSSGVNLHDAKEAFRNDVLADIGYNAVSILGVEANIANDIRHLARSEVEEVSLRNFFSSGEVGSSTMPHKMNPKDFENVVSLWKAYMPRVVSLLSSQITEHQGDSTNDFVEPATYEILIATSFVTKELDAHLKKIEIVT